ncbi:MAG: hypothetical protein F4010_05310 [Cenarchaeum sp. SB0669_bin_11]|nr:hypothetical protein [Cenarchaeum sp. SB0669_bin_11]
MSRYIEVRHLPNEAAARQALDAARKTWPSRPWQIRPAFGGWVLEYVERPARPVHPRQGNRFRERAEAARLI